MVDDYIVYDKSVNHYVVTGGYLYSYFICHWDNVMPDSTKYTVYTAYLTTRYIVQCYAVVGIKGAIYLARFLLTEFSNTGGIT